jgi:TetR/AcrR family transcriptional regulator, transcriptional repressor for nem operon
LKGGKTMRVSRQQADENRDRIVGVAARQFRERGFDGIGVADLMKLAGLTHGGFYGHFESKEDLIAEACTRALADADRRWTRVAEQEPGNPLAAIAKRYLRAAHRDIPGEGCLLAALGPEVARQAAPVRRAFTAGFRSLVDLLAGLIHGKSKSARREQALAVWASLVGGMVLARAVDDPELSDEILRAVSGSICGLARAKPTGSRS